MSGDDIKKAIKLSNTTIKDVAIAIGYTREHLGRLLAVDEIDSALITAIGKQGVDFSLVIKRDKKISHNEDNGYKTKYVELLEKINADLEKQNKELDIKNKQESFNKSTLLSLLDKITNQIESLNGIEPLLREALETGALKKK